MIEQNYHVHNKQVFLNTILQGLTLCATTDEIT